MKKKNDMISRLEEKTNQITATMKQLEQRLETERWLHGNITPTNQTPLSYAPVQNIQLS